MDEESKQPEQPEILHIGGSRWRRVIQTTLRHDRWLRKRIRAAGLHSFKPRPAESSEEFSLRILDEVDDDAFYELLGGLFVPGDLDDLQWTAKLAAETAAFFDNLTDERDKAALSSIFVAVVVGFLVSDNAFARPSATASAEGAVALRETAVTAT